MSIRNPSSLKKGSNEKKKEVSKTREVIELEAILADLQDSPLKLGSPVKYSPSQVRCSPRTNSAQKLSSPVSFKRNLEKDYFLPSVVVKKIDFKSPSKNAPSSSTESTNRSSVVSPRKPSKSIGVSSHLFNDAKKPSDGIVKSGAVDTVKDNESVAPAKPCIPSQVKHVNGVHPGSSHKLSVTKRNLNSENNPVPTPKNVNLNLSDSDDVLKNGMIKTPTSLKKLNSQSSLNDLKSSAKENPKSKTSRNDKLDTNDIAALLENSDDNDDEDDGDFNLKFDGSGPHKNLDSKIGGESPSWRSEIQHVMGSSRRKTNLKLETYRMGYADEDIIIIKDYVPSPETSTSKKNVSDSPKTSKKVKNECDSPKPSKKVRNDCDSPKPSRKVKNECDSPKSSKKIKNDYNSPKPASSSKHGKGTLDRSKSKPKKNDESDDDLIEEPKSRRKSNLSSKKNGTSALKNDSQAKKREASAPTDSSRKSKARRSLLQEASYSIEDCSQSPLRLKLKRNASAAISSNCNDSNDDSDEEPLMKLRKTETSASKTKPSDAKNDECIQSIKERKTQSLKRKSTRSIVTVDYKEDESGEDEPLIKLKRNETDLNSETKPREKSLRSRDSIKLPKWRILDEMNGIGSSKSPTRSPGGGVKSPNAAPNFTTPKKPITSNMHCNSPKFDQLISTVQNKLGKGLESPVKKSEKSEKEQEPLHKTPNKHGQSDSILSPRKSVSTISFELNECNSRPTRSKGKAVESDKVGNDSPNNVIKKKSNKENLLRSSSVTRDITKTSTKKNVQHNVNSPLKVNSVARDEIPSERIQKSQNTIGVVGNSLDHARIQLMVSAVPKSLPCRDKEFNNIYSFLGRKIEDFAGGCMYISGVPGTGKTATVHAVVRKLQEDVENGDLSPFDFVEINSLRLTEPRQAYTRILQSLTGTKLPSEQALRMLDQKFSGRGRKSTVLLVDELDYLCNRRQDVIYSILEWPMRQGGGVVVLTIANTMDLPERTLKGKVTSRMGLTRLTFQPYTHHQLQEIVMNRLIGNDSFHPDAVQLVARKVAAVSGDARRALDICRRATELVSPTKGESSKTVTIQHVEKAVSQISSGRRILAIKACSTMAQLALRALRDETLRTGIDESNVAHMYKHLLNICALEGVEKPTFGEIQRICTNLESLGLIIAEKGRPDLMRKLSLNVSSDDIHYALNC